MPPCFQSPVCSRATYLNVLPIELKFCFKPFDTRVAYFTEYRQLKVPVQKLDLSGSVLSQEILKQLIYWSKFQKNLKTLVLDNCAWEHKNTEYVFALVKNFANLEIVSFSSCHVKSSSGRFAPMTISLRFLCLPLWQDLVLHLASLKSLHTLDLSYCGVTFPILFQLKNFLKKNRLIELNLVGNKMDFSSIELISTMIFLKQFEILKITLSDIMCHEYMFKWALRANKKFLAFKCYDSLNQINIVPSGKNFDFSVVKKKYPQYNRQTLYFLVFLKKREIESACEFQSKIDFFLSPLTKKEKNKRTLFEKLPSQIYFILALILTSQDKKNLLKALEQDAAHRRSSLFFTNSKVASPLKQKDEKKFFARKQFLNRKKTAQSVRIFPIK